MALKKKRPNLLGGQQINPQAVRGDMSAAIALYRSMGFRDIAAYYHNPFPDVIYMALELLEPAR